MVVTVQVTENRDGNVAGFRDSLSQFIMFRDSLTQFIMPVFCFFVCVCACMSLCVPCACSGQTEVSWKWRYRQLSAAGCVWWETNSRALRAPNH